MTEPSPRATTRSALFESLLVVLVVGREEVPVAVRDEDDDVEDVESVPLRRMALRCSN